MTLVILAAGMGSRYGGLKQIDPITDNGKFIIDFSVYDAIKSGFDKVVFVIKEENLEEEMVRQVRYKLKKWKIIEDEAKKMVSGVCYG